MPGLAAYGLEAQSTVRADDVAMAAPLLIRGLVTVGITGYRLAELQTLFYSLQ
jgi:hypothetical protein